MCSVLLVRLMVIQGIWYFTEDATFVTNSRGNVMLLYRGQKYCKDRTKKHSLVAWRCSKKKARCRATVTTLDKRVVQAYDVHNHK